MKWEPQRLALAVRPRPSRTIGQQRAQKWLATSSSTPSPAAFAGLPRISRCSRRTIDLLLPFVPEPAVYPYFAPLLSAGRRVELIAFFRIIDKDYQGHLALCSFPSFAGTSKLEVVDPNLRLEAFQVA